MKAESIIDTNKNSNQIIAIYPNPPSECTRKNTTSAYHTGYSTARTTVVYDFDGKYDTWQEVLKNRHPSSEVDTPEEIKCYRLGIEEGFEAGQSSQ